MYEAQYNSPQTQLASEIDAIQTVITVDDASILPEAETLLTIGFDTPNPEVVKVILKTGNDLTIERGIEGSARVWDGGTNIARIFTAYDYNALVENILENSQGGQTVFTTTHKFLDDNYVYIVGDIVSGWRVNRYDIANNKTVSSGSTNKPTTLVSCQNLTYS